MCKKAIIIGAGPAGLTAAYELVNKTDIKPIIIEKSNDFGGLSKTVNYKGNRIDIGGHRFFSKSDIVMKWWQEILPLEGSGSVENQKKEITYHNKKRTIELNPKGPDPEKEDKVMLIRNRLSRIFFLKRFFDYPISLNMETISNLGILRMVKICWSYLWIQLFPIKHVQSLEDFFINRFGKELYKTFFKDYTEKVWGMPCNKISASWGAQRIKQLSVKRALKHAIKSFLKKDSSIEQKNTDTSLIEQFMYPKFGPGQMWETVAEKILAKGGRVIKNAEVIEIYAKSDRIGKIVYLDNSVQEKSTVYGDYFFSTMPVKELIRAFKSTDICKNVRAVSEGLQYRDFITIGVLLNKLKINGQSKHRNGLISDNWIYIQEKGVKLGRLQVFNNWSPYMIKDQSKIWMGLEYFCNEGDELWTMDDKSFSEFAVEELESIGIIDKKEVLDSTVIRVPKTYPAYFGTYSQFHEIRNFTDNFKNLFLIGRNGMHKYNNQDHSMLTAITAVENIIKGIETKENIWNINTEMDYHEEK
ncbi:NAD(P)/FAD-dependent oxidoreductase [Sinomicrobium sp. M5D2P17]